MILYDEKLQKIKEGDDIVFNNISNPDEQICVMVKSFHRFDPFRSLYESLSLDKCGIINYSETPYDSFAEFVVRDLVRKVLGEIAV